MKYEFIKQNHTEFAVSICCDVLSVSRSGYYAWLKWKPGKRAAANVRLDAEIVALYEEHKHRAGSPRLTKELNGKGEHCSENRVARRMNTLGLRALAKRKFKVTTDSEHTKPVFENVLQREFTTTAVNQKWCGDITYIPTAEVY
jgi:putative transposase